MKKNPLLQYGNVPVSGKMIESCYPQLEVPSKKVQSLEKEGDLIRLKRGLYVVSLEISGKPINAPLCANHIYGPSYVSLRWALRWYGLIPEQVHRMTSVTIKRSRSFETPIGFFDYYQVKPSYFSIGLRIVQEDGVSFIMATPEKALCDFVLFDSYLPNRSVKGLKQFLEEDIRLDMDELMNFDVKIIESCAEQGGKKSILKNLIKIILR
ncbi:MAG: hypothetical protein IKW93_06410 [Bacteroidales bacterium]|nr:hypothetical protein [Bacteroidales bacterium]